MALASVDERFHERLEKAVDVGLANDEIERELNGMALNVRHALRAAALATLLLEFFPEPLETPGPELFQIRRRNAAIVHI